MPATTLSREDRQDNHAEVGSEKRVEVVVSSDILARGKSTSHGDEKLSIRQRQEQTLCLAEQYNTDAEYRITKQ